MLLSARDLGRRLGADSRMATTTNALGRDRESAGSLLGSAQSVAHSIGMAEQSFIGGGYRPIVLLPYPKRFEQHLAGQSDPCMSCVNWARELMPSLANALWTWVFTVCRERCSSVATSRLVTP